MQKTAPVVHALIMASMTLIAACSTSKQDKPLIKLKSSQALTDKKLQSFHQEFTKKCDTEHTEHLAATKGESFRFINKEGWLTINGRPLSGSCFNVVAHTVLKKVIESNGGQRFIERSAPKLTKKIANRVTDRYFMALYPERFKPATTDEAKAYYEKNKNEFRVADQVGLKSIVVHSKGKQTIKDGEKPSVISQGIYAALQKDPTQFDMYAKKYSHAPVDHGRLSVLMNPLSKQYLKSMKMGETSKPIKIEHFGDVDGYVIFRKDIYKKGYLMSFEQSEENVKKILFSKKKEALVDIKKQHEIKIVHDGSACRDCAM